MTSTAVLVPTGITDDWRAQAREYVAQWYATNFPSAPVVFGECAPGSEWSKGEAIAAALAQTSADVLVLADADSFLLDPADLGLAIRLVELGERPWAVPHSQVYRLRDAETARLHANPTAKPRLGHLARAMYFGPLGGGITVVSRAAFELVGGIDPRFLGWGGEDVAFGWALETLAPGGERLDGRLVHLWHPHPAPDLRGSPASEDLVAEYRQARMVTRRMIAAIAGHPQIPAEQLAEPVRFRMTANRRQIRLPSGHFIPFTSGSYETTDPDEVEQLRRYDILREERRR